MIFVGDVHGKFSQFGKIVEDNPGKRIWQVGDMGIGFGQYPSAFSPNVRFIRGNHDNPLLCGPHINYLGDYGVEIIRENKELRSVFYVSGAFSTDQLYRTEGRDWWRGEELTYRQGQDCIDEYVKFRPEIVLSHDCPKSVVELICGTANNTATNQLLQAVFELHQPKLWVFGHHHISWQQKVQGTQFICLNELETVEI